MGHSAGHMSTRSSRRSPASPLSAARAAACRACCRTCPPPAPCTCIAAGGGDVVGGRGEGTHWLASACTNLLRWVHWAGNGPWPCPFAPRRAKPPRALSTLPSCTQHCGAGSNSLRRGMLAHHDIIYRCHAICLHLVVPSSGTAQAQPRPGPWSAAAAAAAPAQPRQGLTSCSR